MLFPSGETLANVPLIVSESSFVPSDLKRPMRLFEVAISASSIVSTMYILSAKAKDVLIVIVVKVIIMKDKIIFLIKNLLNDLILKIPYRPDSATVFFKKELK